jgi:hypothetical protein
MRAARDAVELTDTQYQHIQGHLNISFLKSDTDVETVSPKSHDSPQSLPESRFKFIGGL